jgi:hypothetical protein
LYQLFGSSFCSVEHLRCREFIVTHDFLTKVMNIKRALGNESRSSTRALFRVERDTVGLVAAWAGDWYTAIELDGINARSLLGG